MSRVLAILILIASCNTYYTGIVKTKGYPLTIETQVAQNHYVLVTVTIDDYDSIQIGDTLIIDKTTLRLVKY